MDKNTETLINNTEKIPMPVVKPKLFLPIGFWSEVLVHLDKKTETLSELYGYGKVEMTITIMHGKVQDVIFNDEVRIRGLVDRAGLKGTPNAPESESTLDQIPPAEKAK